MTALADGLSPALADFIRDYIPSYDAARVLLFLFANRVRYVEPEAIAFALPNLLTPATAMVHASRFVGVGLATREGSVIRFAAASARFEQLVDELAIWDKERPVTLISAIYRIARGSASRVDAGR